jgi:predicted porin
MYTSNPNPVNKTMTLYTLLGLTGAVGLALFSAPVAAQTVDVYGRLVLSVNRVQTGNNSNNELRDNASRLGFRGVEDLGGGLKALFGLEMGISADSGNPTTPAFRNSYVALRGDWGTVALGRLDSANPTGSPIYSQWVTLTSFAPNDAGATATSNVMFNARNRTSNSIGYASPDFAGFSMKARTYLRGADTAADPEDSSRSVDLGLNYEAGSLKAGLGMARDARRGGLKSNEFEDKLQAGFNYNFGQMDVYLVGGVDRYNNTATTRREVRYGELGGSIRLGAHKIVLNLMQRDVQASLTAVRPRQQLSDQYFLSKRTQLQFFFDNDSIDSSKSGVRVRTFGAGIRHDF